ncbi:hypothetical protein LTR85_001157 [Meristemomyces frigidus]|nr:hypothetical protein LTR85_001157 [Meristemomyces frigidus]
MSSGVQQAGLPYGQQDVQHPQQVQPYALQAAQPVALKGYAPQQHGQILNQGANHSQQMISTTTTTVKSEVVKYKKANHQIQQPAIAQTPATQPAPIDYNSLKVTLPSGSQQQANASTTNVATQTTTTTQSGGGQYRQAAAAKGDAQLQKFDEKVNKMLIDASSMCWLGYP